MSKTGNKYIIIIYIKSMLKCYSENIIQIIQGTLFNCRKRNQKILYSLESKGQCIFYTLESIISTDGLTYLSDKV